MSEVLTPEVIEELPLEKQIDNTLVTNNVTDAVIASLKKEYGGMKLRTIDNKEDYIDIKEARKIVRKVGILTESLCKKGREDANKIQKLWIKKENEILAKIAEVQDPLDAEIKKYDDEVARKDAEEKERQAQQFIKRQSELLKYGASYENGSYVLNHISYESSNIQEADDEVYNDIILPKYKKQFEVNEAARVEEETKREAAALKLKEEQATLLQQQQELENQKREFEKQQSEMQKLKDEADRLRREQENKVANEIKEREDARNKARMNQVLALGMQYKFDDKAFSVHDVFVAQIEIATFEDQQWNELIAKITPVITERKEAAEKNRLAEIEKQKQEAIELAAKQERERIELENEQKELLRKQTELKAQEEAAKASDRDKFIALVAYLSAAPIPEFKSSVYKGKLAVLKEKLEEIVNL